MDVGKILSGSHLLQRLETNENTTTARAGSHTIGRVNNIEEHFTHVDKEEQLSKEKTKEIVESINKFLEPTQTELKFQFHEKLDEYYVTIIDPQTKETIKEIPPKKLLDMYAAMAEFMGFIVDQKI